MILFTLGTFHIACIRKDVCSLLYLSKEAEFPCFLAFKDVELWCLPSDSPFTKGKGVGSFTLLHLLGYYHVNISYLLADQGDCSCLVVKGVVDIWQTLPLIPGVGYT